MPVGIGITEIHVVPFIDHSHYLTTPVHVLYLGDSRRSQMHLHLEARERTEGRADRCSSRSEGSEVGPPAKMDKAEQTQSSVKSPVCASQRERERERESYTVSYSRLSPAY